MVRAFTGFVLFAEMRTGSNFLEEALNAFPDLACFGELFNPQFVGHEKRTEMCGISLAARERDPLAMLSAIRQAVPQGLAGFRFFHDHDPRILQHVLADPGWAKIVLTRNPLESYVSRKIAAQTGQWRLTDGRHRRDARVRFDATEFERLLDRLQNFQLRLLHGLQTSGQTAFYLGYEDIGDLDVINGLAAWLGSAHRVEALPGKLKKQNPQPMGDLVTNPREMARALAALDRFDLSRTPNFEPRRGAGVPGFQAASAARLLHMPLRGGPVTAVGGWLSRIEAAAGGGELQTGFTQRALHQWKRATPGHRSFCVLRHPLARAHDAFCRHILPLEGRDAFLAIRGLLTRDWGLVLPGAPSDPAYDAAAHRAAFAGFLGFLRANLAGQTSVRVDPAWASQGTVVQGMVLASPLDHLWREEELPEALGSLAARLGLAPVPYHPESGPGPWQLRDICDDALQALAAEVYQRDMMLFGFGRWAPG
ncbi:MAG: nodulation protein NodH [Alphaproteobacteria bacterium HGW-Alphaproteobacteria-2]|nr:MAG: nodulation protein NodH [Alphaproteobacteria bacterium HGW-Alphaproteobacteria-2]